MSALRSWVVAMRHSVNSPAVKITRENLPFYMPCVYQTTNMGEAHIRIALVDRGSADLLVHRVASRSMAHANALWYITRDRQEASVLACFTSQGMAQLKICFVDSYGEAGWQVKKPRHVHL